MQGKITKPIFIVGMPRSGTSVFYESLGRHPDLCWISQSTKQFPRSPFLSRVVMGLRRDGRPTEGHRIWRKFARPEHDALGREDVTAVQKAYYRDVVRAQQRIRNKPRFLGKYPRNGLRIPYLDEIFPDAVFIHFIRDGRAVARSLIHMREYKGDRRRYWGIKPPGWERLLDLDPLEAVGRQYTMTVDYIRTSAACLAPGRYLELRYEDFCAAPAEALHRVGRACDLHWTDDGIRTAAAGVQSCNYKWKEELEPAEIERLDRVMGDTLAALDYPVS